MPPETAEDRALAAFARRTGPGRPQGPEAGRIVRACLAMAARFRRGGTLLTFGEGVAAADAAHIAVEFVHPVVVGKRALPAISLSCDPAPLAGVVSGAGPAGVFAARVRSLARPRDIALGLSPDGRCLGVLRGLEAAHDQGALTVALTGGDGGDLARSPAVGHVLVAASDDPRVVRETHVTVYHVLWELVHVLLERPEPLEEEALS